MDRCDDCGHVIDCVGNCKCPPKEPWADFLLPDTTERIVRSVHTADVLLIRGEQFSDGLYRLVIPQDSSDALESAVREAMAKYDAEVQMHAKTQAIMDLMKGTQ